MSSNRNLLIRSMHDVGLAAWFGGSLMGAVGLNGASQDLDDPIDRTRSATAGWARWSPVAASAIGTHLIGGAGLVLAHRNAVKHQSGVTSNTVAKLAVTAAAMATTAYSGALGARIAAAGDQPSHGATEPDAGTPATVASAQKQQRLLQWLTPALTGVLIVLGAQQGEQQRPGERLRGVRDKAAKRSGNALAKITG